MSSLLKLKKNSKSKLQKENTEWVLEGIVGYLHSPGWDVHVMNFFDDNCSIFENKEENKLEYTDVHIKYKALVEQLLATYIKELDISEDLFAKACNQHNSTLKDVEKLFEYVWAADDFILFKRLMVKHNIEIEMQAINLLQALDGTSENFDDNPPYNPRFVRFQDEEASTSLFTESQDSLSGSKEVMREILDESQGNYASQLRRQRELEAREASDLKKAIEFSKLEMDLLNAQAEEERRMLDEAIRLSLEFANLASNPSSAIQESTVPPVIPSDVAAKASVSNLKLPSPLELASPPTPQSGVAKVTSHADEATSHPKPKSSKKSSLVQESLPPLRQKGSADAALDWLTDAQKVAEKQKEADDTENSTPTRSTDSPPTHKSGIDPADLAKRKQYLQEQREKLLSRKKKQREEELLRYESESPRSKKASNDEHKDSDAGSDDNKMMIARRALADRLKREVIMKK